MQLDKWCVGRPIHFHRICVKASMPPCTSPHAGAMPLPEFINGSQTRLLSSLSTGKSIITLKRRCYDDTQGRRDHQRITWNYKALIHIISRIHKRGRNQRAARNRISRKNQRNVAERVPCGRNFIFAGTDLVVRRTSYTGDKATLLIICFINTF